MLDRFNSKSRAWRAPKVTHIVCAFAAGVAVSIAGCETRSASNNEIVPVSGIVSLDEKPLSGVKILFVPVNLRDKSGNYLPSSWAVSDEEGRFQLAISNSNEDEADQVGATVGRHRVWISTRQLPPKPADEDSDKEANDAAEEPQDERLPAEYNRLTELTFDVPTQGTSSANFELTSD